MKTVKCIFSKHTNLDHDVTSPFKKYSFNIEGEVKEGDVLKTTKYDNFLHVTDICPETHKFVNIRTSETYFSMPENPDGIFPITEIVILPQGTIIGKVL